jgi:LSD1 subclass zinc finger protein
VRVTCESCHTAYDLPPGGDAQIGCPICNHVNRGSGLAVPPPKPPVSAEPFDAGKTVVAPLVGDFGEETTKARAVIAGKTAGLPKERELHLLVVEGDREGERIPITKTRVTIGRKGAEITLNDPEASRRHCTLTVYDDLVFVQDLGSANGTLVNNRVINETILRNGETLQVGATILKLSVQNKT